MRLFDSTLDVARDHRGAAVAAPLGPNLSLYQRPVDPNAPDGAWEMVTSDGRVVAPNGCNQLAAHSGLWMRRFDAAAEPLEIWDGATKVAPLWPDGRVGDVNAHAYCYFDKERTRIAIVDRETGFTGTFAIALEGEVRLWDNEGEPAIVYRSPEGAVRLTSISGRDIHVYAHPDAHYPLAFRDFEGELWVAYYTDTYGFIAHVAYDMTQGYTLAPPMTVWAADVQMRGADAIFALGRDPGLFDITNEIIYNIHGEHDMKPFVAMSTPEPTPAPAPPATPPVQPPLPGIPAPAPAPSTEALPRGTFLSEDGRLRFVLQNDGNAVIYGPNGPLWDTRTTGFRDARDPAYAALNGGVTPPLGTVASPVSTPQAPAVHTPWAPPAWWLGVTENDLRSFRGDLGGVRLSVNTSERRGRYLFTPTYVTFDSAKRALIRREYKSRGYTHFAIGGPYDEGYPGWSGFDFVTDPRQFRDYLGLIHELIDDGLIPVTWLMIDKLCNASHGEGNDRNPIDYAKVDHYLTPLYLTADWQAVCKTAVLGWEVTDKGWVKTKAEALKLCQWGQRVAPHAYRLWHAAANNGAPCNYDIDGEGCEGSTWKAMAPHIHGHFFQDGSAGGWHLAAGRDSDNPQHRKDQFLDNLRYDVMRLRGNHYRAGGLLGADGKLLDVIAGEYSAYFEANDGLSEAEAREYGRLAMTVEGVRGFMDGGPA